MRAILLLVVFGFAVHVATAQAPRSTPNNSGFGRPPIQIVPPVSEEEAKLLAEMGKLSELVTAGDKEAQEKLRGAVEAHFDLLSEKADARIVELRQHLQKVIDAADRRKAARAALVEAELNRILIDAKSLQFYPDTLSLLRTPGQKPAIPVKRGGDSSAD